MRPVLYYRLFKETRYAVCHSVLNLLSQVGILLNDAGLGYASLSPLFQTAIPSLWVLAQNESQHHEHSRIEIIITSTPPL